MEKRLQLFDLSDDARTIAGECELSGRQTVIERNGRPIAIVTSWDEYMALKETLAVVNDDALRAALVEAEQQLQRGEVAPIEDLAGGDLPAGRLRIAPSILPDRESLSESSRAAVAEALRTIDDDPIVGAPLLPPLRGYWSHRAGDHRIVYRLLPEARVVAVLAVHRIDDRLFR